MTDIRTHPGKPPIGVFGHFAGTPLTIDEQTGKAYWLGPDNTVWPLLTDRATLEALSHETQTCPAINTPTPIRYDTANQANDVALTGAPATKLTVSRAGLYNVHFSAQAITNNASLHYIYIWPRLNGVDIPNSASKATLKEAGAAKVLSWNWWFELASGDELELFWAVSAVDLELVYELPNGFHPGIPSMILTIWQVA